MKLGCISSHARIRMKQRNIPQQALEVLFAVGQVRNAEHGGKVVYFGHAGRSHLSKTLPAPKARHWAHLYAVLDTRDEVITVGHRSKRVGRH